MTSQFLFDRGELGPHAITARLPSKLEVAAPGFPADMRESEECKGLRFALPAPLAIRRRMASELDQPGFLQELRRQGAQSLNSALAQSRQIGDCSSCHRNHSLVEPRDVRWIFVTHNDSDHSGNLVEALE